MDEWASPPFVLYEYLWTGCGRGKCYVYPLCRKKILKKKFFFFNFKPPIIRFTPLFAVHIVHISRTIVDNYL